MSLIFLYKIISLEKSNFQKIIILVVKFCYKLKKKNTPNHNNKYFILVRFNIFIQNLKIKLIINKIKYYYRCTFSFIKI